MAWVEQCGDDTWRVRYRRDDGTIGAIPGFTSKTAAQDHADDLESDRRRGTWIDPAAGQTTLSEFVDPDWFDALDVDPRTEQNYRNRWAVHIQPRWGDTALSAITGLKAHAWAKKLRAGGLAPVTVDDIMKLFRLMLSDAADEKLIPANPIRPRRRGRRRHTTRTPEKVWAEPAATLDVADQAAAFYGPGAGVLVVTGGWTGSRWGELAGLRRPNLHLFDDDTGDLVVDPETGALHEDSTGKLWLGPPKTEESARTISLPPFLVRLLRAHLETHDHEHVFVSLDGQLLRRSNFSRRAMRPAADGNLQVRNPRIRLQPACAGLTFHGLRHGHKTWMIADGIPEIAQSVRLGHVLKDKIQRTYSHVADEVEARLLDHLQARWEKAVANAATNHDTTWRAAA
ncbi:tyrosine-type recombinase/integrase [Haloechinothrix halophila]|uniref:tyrosine-type recombinase/integrase n=1 Tax=Haloechinothrix halophila TaxID=1069073 RepID=UPI000401D257|nr:tyrosine-type recombinase/integrase [Haloechinothrix halophila]